jgi:hypothetical protein
MTIHGEHVKRILCELEEFAKLDLSVLEQLEAIVKAQHYKRCTVQVVCDEGFTRNQERPDLGQRMRGAALAAVAYEDAKWKASYAEAQHEATRNILAIAKERLREADAAVEAAAHGKC